MSVRSPFPAASNGTAPTELCAQPSRAIELKTLHPAATFLRILGVNYIHINTDDEGDLYVTEHGIPFIAHLQPQNWYEEPWFSQNRQRLIGTSTIYRLPTKPLIAGGSVRPSIDLVIKWSRVGQDAALSGTTLQRNINAEFNTPFEEFARVEELRKGDHGPREIRVLTQKPLAIFVPPERMQPWQTGRSVQRILARTSRHPGIEIDVLRAYIMLYGWIDGLNAIDTFKLCMSESSERQKQLEELTLRVDREMRAKGFLVADHKPTHFILRTRHKGGQILRRRRWPEQCEQYVYALVDYELLSRTSDYEDWVRAGKRREYLIRQKERFLPRAPESFPANLRPAKVLDVPYVHGRAESTNGLLWVVGNDPELFYYFLPERWRTEQQVRLSQTGQTYYAQTKDRVHLIWKVSRVGDFPPGELPDPGYKQLLLQGYNSPFEEFALALRMSSKGIKTVCPRAIYMTASPGDMSGIVEDDRRFDRMRKLRSPLGVPVMPSGHDYVTIWGFWRGLPDDAAVDDIRLWTPIDVASALDKGIIDQADAQRVMRRHAEQLAAAGFCDSNLKPDHVLLCYVPSGAVKTDADSQIESRQCNFELVRAV